MSDKVADPLPGKGRAPAWDESAKRSQTKLAIFALVSVVVAIWIILIVWVIFLAPDVVKGSAGIGENLTLILAPILAASAGVERILEITFNLLENSWKTMVAYLGRGMRWLKVAETEVEQSRQWLADVSDLYKAEMSQIKFDANIPLDQLTQSAQARMKSADDLLAFANKRLAEAEANLAAAPDSESYKSVKAIATTVLGLMLGVIIARLGAIQMFALLGIGGLNARVDVLITGLVIGSGSNPVHSLIGILQQTKDTLDSAQGFLNRPRSTTPPESSRVGS